MAEQELSQNTSTPVPASLPRHWGLGEILTAKDNRSVVKTLVLFTFAMVAVPVSTFFAIHDVLLVDYDYKTRTFCSGMAAVLGANIVIAAYAIMAIKEDSGDGGNTRRLHSTPLKVD